MADSATQLHILSAFRGKYGRLLAAIILLIISAPLVALGSPWGPILTTLQCLALVASIRASSPRRRSLAIGGALSLLTLVIRLKVDFHNPAQTHLYLLVDSVVILSVFAYATISVLGAVLNDERVTLETIQASLCVYLLVGLAFVYLYSIIGLVQGGAFAFPVEPPAQPSPLLAERHRFLQLVYFSYATLTTLGYGDITPRAGLAQMFACLEAIIGQVYLTVLVARLVGLHIAQTPGDPS